MKITTMTKLFLVLATFFVFNLKNK